MQRARRTVVTPAAEAHPSVQASPQPDDGLETLISDVLGAVLSLEYGAVTISVQGGRVVQLERNEKRRLAKPGASKPGVNKPGVSKPSANKPAAGKSVAHAKPDAAQRFN